MHAVIPPLLAATLLVGPVTAQEPPWEVWRDLHRLAELPAGDQVLLRSSHCLSGCRFDRHSAGDWRFLRRDGPEGVIFEEEGAGAIVRLWMTTGQGVSQPLDPAVRLRVYVDSAPTPVLDLPLPALFDGSTPPFLPPLVADRMTSSGGHVSYVPIPYRNGCRVVLVGAETSTLWYQVSFHRLRENTGVVSFTGREDLSALAVLLSQRGQDPWQLETLERQGSPRLLESRVTLAPGETATVLTAAGPDTLTALLLRLAPELWGKVELRLRFDGEQRARLPLADFFAIGRGGAEPTRSLFVGLDSDGDLYSYFPMPFFSSAAIELRSLVASGTEPVTIDFLGRLAGRAPAPSSGLFGARLNVSEATMPGRDFELLRLEGRGKWVGLFAELGSVGTPARQYLEGDERVYLDGSPHPMLYGTGVEDFFGGGFYFDQGPFGQALHGSPYHLQESGEDVTAAYRLLLTDAPTFEANLLAGLESGPEGQLAMRARTVVWYYQRPSPRLVRLDRLEVGDAASRLEHGWEHEGRAEPFILDSAFEGEPPRPYAARGLYRSADTASFTLRAPAGARQLRLRRRFDAGLGGQRAEVFVEGMLAGCFPASPINPDRRWGDVDLDLPPGVETQAKDLQITIRPKLAAGENLFSELVYELWGSAECAPCPLFDDGFESGDGLPWSSETP